MKDYQYPRIPDEEYQTLLGHVRQNVGLIMYGLHLDEQGHQIETKLAIQGIMEQFEIYGMAVRGKPEPVKLSAEWVRRLESTSPDD